MSLCIFANYYFELDESIRKNSLVVKLIAWTLVFALVFGIPWLVYRLILKRNYTRRSRFLYLFLIAPLLFAIKISLDIHFQFSGDDGWNNYWNNIVYWPLLMLITGCLLLITWKLSGAERPFYGLTARGVIWKPYLLMLLIMLPLIALASTQKDFLAVYPKLQAIESIFTDERITWWHKLLFELSYGSDFFTIELFFRGFLVLAFIKCAGKDAILPMACFYCSIHFGKPIAECISSYFGGLILGVIVYNTRSIYGGLLVHLGIAWIMELGGYFGNSV
ncbi:MAG TPA: CPBP family intramembrane glutamic endopeptidase [Chitinophagaceae bacterium]|nr:CPBP family intramembrane glutamic endopeptidase [Chitinophagaceae bacterium]